MNYLRQVFVCLTIVSLFFSVRESAVGAENPKLQRWPSLKNIQTLLQDIANRHPEKVQLSEAGTSIDGHPIPLAVITDSTVGNENKEHILFTTLHSGIERSATTSALYLIRWLLSNDPVAQETLKKQVVVCMPVVNPDGYLAGTFTNKKGKDPYLAWNLDGPSMPDESPELVAVQKVMDQYQPEVLSDLHGLDLSIDGYLMVEISGPAYSNSLLRPYHHSISRMMEEAAVEAGFPMDRAEQDAEKIFWGPHFETISHKLWLGRPRIYGAFYAYNKFHSIILTSECAWEKSALVRQRRLLQIGNDIWPGEHDAGYPTRIMMKNSFHLVAAYGQTAVQRRKSRVELWNKIQHFSHGMDNPQQLGKVTYVCCTSAAARKQWLADTSLRGFAENVGFHPMMQGEVIQKHLRRHADGVGQWGKEAQIYLTGKNEPAAGGVVIENGLALRLRVPYSKASINALHLNGHPCEPSAIDGYEQWSARGYSHIQINIPPEKSKVQNLWIVTLDYDPREERTQGWESLLQGKGYADFAPIGVQKQRTSNLDLVADAKMFTANPSDDLQQTDVFARGQNGYHTYRIPSLLVTPRGSLLAICEGRKTGGGDHGDLDLVMKRSNDLGKSWSDLQLIYEEGGKQKITIGNPCPVVDQSTGTIWLPFCRDNRDILMTSSSDDGHTWSVPREITVAVKPAGWSWVATGPGVGIQLTREKYRGRLVIPCDHYEERDGGKVKMSHLFYSDDHGQTWQLGGSVADHTDECQVVELDDGRLMMNMRNYWARDGGKPEWGGKRAVAISADGGQTWGDLKFDPTLIEPVCQASFLKYSCDQLQPAPVLFSNPASSNKRHRLTVRLSHDGANTWPVERLLHRGPAAYSCLAVLPDRSIGCLFECGATDAYEKIRFSRFTLHWLQPKEK